jgi:hypothetical protein
VERRLPGSLPPGTPCYLQEKAGALYNPDREHPEDGFQLRIIGRRLRIENGKVAQDVPLFIEKGNSRLLDVPVAAVIVAGFRVTAG